MTRSDTVETYWASVHALEAELRRLFLRVPIDARTGMIIHSLAVRYRDDGMTAVLRATDDELLGTRHWGPRTLARWRAVVPEPVDTRDPGWVEHAEMTSLAEPTMTSTTSMFPPWKGPPRSGAGVPA